MCGSLQKSNIWDNDYKKKIYIFGKKMKTLNIKSFKNSFRFKKWRETDNTTAPEERITKELFHSWQQSQGRRAAPQAFARDT